ncbi:hypothetical protein ACFXPM_12585 [Streptomyces sp. NPDC059095]|uniref:hypothetical protein n=1 Tax=Streptomyces sp. NPDC059095 TaxID=3346726 RepID=UPI0036AD4A30
MSFWRPVVRGAVRIGVRSEMRIGVRIEVVPPSASSARTRRRVWRSPVSARIE